MTSKSKFEEIFHRLKTSPKPYLITGSQASYRYHRWLTPAPKIIELRIYPDDETVWWKNYLQDKAIYISEAPSTYEMVMSLDAAVLLSKNLTAQLYHRKRTLVDLHYESPEDLCLGFLQNTGVEITVMETLAMFLVQRQTLQWDYLCEQAAVVLPRYIMDKLDLDLEYVWRNQFLVQTTNLEKRQATAPIFN